MSLAPRLARFAAELSFDQLPPPVIAAVGDRLLDTLGVCVAGRELDATRAAYAMSLEVGAGDQASVIGGGRRLPAVWAALVNGTCAHGLDFDDSHLPSIVHPSATLVPAVFAQAEASGADAHETIVALVAAYELMIRLANAQYDPELGNSVFFERGLHATSMLGALAAAAACARLRGLDGEGIAHALAIACSQSAGLLESNRAGGSVKRIHTGWAAHAAIAAAALAAHGVTGPPTVLEGRFGYFQAFCGERWNPAAVTEALGERWDTLDIHVKPYPCNHFTHAIVDAVRRLRSSGLAPEEVAAVEIGTAGPSLRTIGEPIEVKRHPRSSYEARFSAPFVFATALVGGGGLGVAEEDFGDAALTDVRRQALAECCDVTVDADCDRLFPGAFPAVVRVRTRAGEELEARVDFNRGSPTHPLSPEELRSKLEQTAGGRATAIALQVQRLLDGEGDAAAVMSATAAANDR